MSDARIIELTIPGLLQFRDMALRVVMESCNLVGKLDADAGTQEADHGSQPSEKFEFRDQFTVEFTSAFSEIYNNIALHAYAGVTDGTIEFKLSVGQDHLILDIADMGKSFDIQSVPLPDELPTGGMGIHIARTMLDDLIYESGPPNRWRLVKYVRESQSQPPPSEASAGS